MQKSRCFTGMAIPFDLPAGAELLASSEHYKQIYRIGSQVLAFQCHPELEG